MTSPAGRGLICCREKQVMADVVPGAKLGDDVISHPDPERKRWLISSDESIILQ